MRISPVFLVRLCTGQGTQSDQNHTNHEFHLLLYFRLLKCSIWTELQCGWLSAYKDQQKQWRCNSVISCLRLRIRISTDFNRKSYISMSIPIHRWIRWMKQRNVYITDCFASEEFKMMMHFKWSIELDINHTDAFRLVYLWRTFP